MFVLETDEHNNLHYAIVSVDKVAGPVCVVPRHISPISSVESRDTSTILRQRKFSVVQKSFFDKSDMIDFKPYNKNSNHDLNPVQHERNVATLEVLPVPEDHVNINLEVMKQLRTTWRPNQISIIDKFLQHYEGSDMTESEGMEVASDIGSESASDCDE